MDTYKLKSTEKPLKIEIFKSSSEMIRTLKQREVLMDSDYLSKDGRFDMRFNGYNDPEKMLREFEGSICDPKIVREVQNALKSSGVRTRKVRRPDVVGFTPIVPLAIMGLPECMLRQESQRVKDKVLEVIVEANVSGYVPKDRMIQVGLDLVSEIVAMEKKGHRVGLTVVKANENRGRDISVGGYRVKEAESPVNPARMIYPFVNPSFQRGVMFAWYQRAKEITRCTGYGTPLAICDPGKKIRNEIATMKHARWVSFMDLIEGKKAHDALQEVINNI